MKFNIRIIVFLAFVNIFLFGAILNVHAQFQGDTPFSGNSIENYQCFDENGQSIRPTSKRDSRGYWLCPCNDGSEPTSTGICGYLQECEKGEIGAPGCPAARSVLKPPTLQQIEIWFVRIIYIIWALIATLSVFYLMLLGYRYMISRGDVTKITEIRQKIIYYVIGFALVFLAIPILSTVFNLFGINEQSQCYNVGLDEIGFQFFFPDLCTAPKFVNNACEYLNTSGSPVGRACTEPNFANCGTKLFKCQNNIWTEISDTQ